MLGIIVAKEVKLVEARRMSPTGRTLKSLPMIRNPGRGQLTAWAMYEEICFIDDYSAIELRLLTTTGATNPK